MNRVEASEVVLDLVSVEKILTGVLDYLPGPAPESTVAGITEAVSRARVQLQNARTRLERALADGP